MIRDVDSKLAKLALPVVKLDYEAKAISLRQKNRAKGQEMHRLTTSQFYIYKFSPMAVEHLPQQLVSIFPDQSLENCFENVLKLLKNQESTSFALNFIREVLLDEQPAYITLMNSGIIQELLMIFYCKNQSFSIILECLCNFACGPKECCEILRKISGFCVFLDKIDSVLDSKETVNMIKTLGNLIDSFTAFSEFKQVNGLFRIFEKINAWAENEEIMIALGDFCVVLCEYIQSFTCSEMKTFTRAFEKICKKKKFEGEENCLYVIESICEKTNEASEAMIWKAIECLERENSRLVIRALQIIGNSACRNPNIFTSEMCGKVLDKVLIEHVDGETRKNVIWMLRGLILKKDLAEDFSKHRLFGKIGLLLADSEVKTRKQAVKLFQVLFSSTFFNSCNPFVPMPVIEGLSHGIDMCIDNNSIKDYLEIIESLSLNLNEYTEIELESSDLLKKVENFLYHKNPEISFISEAILDLFQRFFYPQEY